MCVDERFGENKLFRAKLAFVDLTLRLIESLA